MTSTQPVRVIERTVITELPMIHVFSDCASDTGFAGFVTMSLKTEFAGRGSALPYVERASQSKQTSAGSSTWGVALVREEELARNVAHVPRAVGELYGEEPDVHHEVGEDAHSAARAPTTWTAVHVSDCSAAGTEARRRKPS